MENKIDPRAINIYITLENKIFRRCLEVAEQYYEADLWKRGIHYICGFNIVEDKIEIFEGYYGQDLEFKLTDFINDELLEIAIKKDIEEYEQS